MKKTTGYVLASGILCILGVTTAPAATGTVTSMAPAAATYGPNGGTGQIVVNATGTWSATTENNWIMITSESGFTDSGTLSYSVFSNNTGKPRTGTIVVGNQYFTVRQPTTDFTDNTDHLTWFYPYINAVYTSGITTGCTSDTFCPADVVTREQMAAFIVRSLNGENFTYNTQPHFLDVPASSWSYPYVQKMKDLGLTTNTGTYDPSGTITREQAAAFVIRALYGENFQYPTTPYFNDVPPSEWSFKYVQKLKEQNLTTSTGTYNPSGIVTRDQMAAFMSRAFLGMMPSSTDVPSNNTAFMASMLMGKSFEFAVPNMGSMLYTFNEDGTFTAASSTGMMGNNFSGKWMINNSNGTMTLDNVVGMMPGYTETYTMMGGGGVLPPMVNYMNSNGGTQTNMMMIMK